MAPKQKNLTGKSLVPKASTRRRGRRPQVCRHTTDEVHDQKGRFGLPKQLDTAGMYMADGGTGAVTTQSQLGLSIVDFFDYETYDAAAGGVTQFVNNYFFRANQNLFNTDPSAPGSQGGTFCRVKKVEVWVLPQRTYYLSLDEPRADTNAGYMFTVNCQVPGTANNADTVALNGAFATNVQVTNVLPLIDTRWKKVLTADLMKTFKSGVIRPWLQPGSSQDQCLFQMSIVDPRNGTPYMLGESATSARGIRVKVKLSVDNPIASVQSAYLAVFANEDFGLPATAQNGAPYGGTNPSYVQMDLTSVGRHNM